MWGCKGSRDIRVERKGEGERGGCAEDEEGKAGDDEVRETTLMCEMVNCCRPVVRSHADDNVKNFYW